VATATSSLPITETLSPSDPQQVTEIVRRCFDRGTAVYPLGGGTSLDYGLPAKRAGVGLSLSPLSQIVDYPARDMTITVQAGLTMQTLADTLAVERQRLPIDVPWASQATLGGVVATNFNGPRRYGQGTIRDYVIGIQAVDGRGLPFKGGGRVVKNVAGYDLCKLLTGSLGTLGVITELTLKLKPQPEKLAFLVAAPSGLEQAEQWLAALTTSQTTPCAIELLAGPSWVEDAALTRGLASPGGLYLAVALEGTEPEVDWMLMQLEREWRELGVAECCRLADAPAQGLMNRLTEFPAAGNLPFVLKAVLTPSGTTRFVQAVRELDGQCDLQAHAGSGIVIARLSEFPSAGLARTLVGKLHPAASAHHGHVEVLANPGGSEMTPHSVWGAVDLAGDVLNAVKRAFDPKNILNPNRFVYAPMD